MIDAAISPEAGPVDNTALSFDKGVEAIESLLSDDPEMDLVGSDEAPGSEVNSEVENDEDEPDLSLDDDEAGEAAEVDAAASTLTDDTEIVLDGGEKISLGQLKRNNLFQRDYSKKTEEFARYKEAEEAKIQALRKEAETEITQRRDFILDNWQRFIPQEPDPAMMDDKSEKFDPIGYLQAKQQYDDTIGRLNAMHAERVKSATADAEKQAAAAAEFAEQEWAKFIGSNKRLQSEDKLKAFRDDVKSIGVEHYGLKPEELQSVTDHRFMQVLHDAIAYRKLVLKSKAVPEKVAVKPKLQANKQRMSIPDVKARDAEGRFQALKKNPNDLRAAERSIMDTLGDI